MSGRGYRNDVMLTLFGSVPGAFHDGLVQQQLEAMPKPRSVTIAWRDRVVLLLVFLFLCLWATLWTRGIIEGWKKQASWNVFGVLFLVVFVFFWLFTMGIIRNTIVPFSTPLWKAPHPTGKPILF